MLLISTMLVVHQGNEKSGTKKKSKQHMPVAYLDPFCLKDPGVCFLEQVPCIRKHTNMITHTHIKHAVFFLKCKLLINLDLKKKSVCEYLFFKSK